MRYVVYLAPVFFAVGSIVAANEVYHLSPQMLLRVSALIFGLAVLLSFLLYLIRLIATVPSVRMRRLGVYISILSFLLFFTVVGYVVGRRWFAQIMDFCSETEAIAWFCV